MDATRRTAFDDMDSDLDFAAATAPQAKPVHVFEAAGLGKAPFRCFNTDDAGGKCGYCGTKIKFRFHLRSADMHDSIVGSECVLKTDAAVHGFKEQRTQLARRLRQQQAAKREQAKRVAKQERREAFAKEYPDVIAWCEKAAERGFNFAFAMREALAEWGTLTTGQLAAVKRCMEQDIQRDAQRKAAIAAQAATAKAVDIAAVERAFAKAKANDIKNPKLRLGGFVLSPAKAHSVNAGAVYVKTQVTREAKQQGEEGVYLGKIMNGKFLKVRECTAEQEAEVVAVASDPGTAAVAYGKRWGECAVCGRVLENHESIDRGIGPICAEKYGF